MWCGRHEYVAHTLGCFAEYFADGRGVLTEPEQISELRQAIVALLDDAQLRARYCQACSYDHERLGTSPQPLSGVARG